MIANAHQLLLRFQRFFFLTLLSWFLLLVAQHGGWLSHDAFFSAELQRTLFPDAFSEWTFAPLGSWAIGHAGFLYGVLIAIGAILSAWSTWKPQPGRIVLATLFLVFQLLQARIGPLQSGCEMLMKSLLLLLCLRSFFSEHEIRERAFLFLVRFQFSYLYLVTGTWKGIQPGWRNGTSLVAAVELSSLSRFPDLLSGWDPFWIAVASSTVWMGEIALGIVPWFPRMASAAFLFGVIFHFGLDLIYTIPIWPWLMICGLTTFLESRPSYGAQRNTTSSLFAWPIR